MNLLFCDSCRRVVDPADLDGGQGARMGDKTYCADCIPGGPGRPRDVASCRDCQVAVIHAVQTSGGEVDHATHPICRRCTKNPVCSPLSPHQVGCAGCDRNVALQDLRIGIALPIGGQAWCRQCRTTSGAGIPSAAPTPVTREFAAPEIAAPTIPALPASATPPPDTTAPTRSTRRQKSGELHCDLCSREIGAEELRAGHAQAAGGKLMCGRCRGRSARKAAKRRQTWQIAVSLAFLLVIFPLATAGLAIFIYREVTDTGTGTGPSIERPPVRNTEQEPAPEGIDRSARTPDVTPAKGADQLMAELLAAVRRAAQAGAAAGTPEPAPPTPGPESVAPRFQPAEAPTKGPGAALSAKFAAERAAQQIDRLGDTDPGVRLDAILELASLPPDEAAPGLLRALDDPDPFLRASAATAAGKCGHESLMQPLLNKLGDPEQRVRRAVARALGRIVRSESFYLFEDLSEDQLQNLRRAIEQRKARKG